MKKTLLVCVGLTIIISIILIKLYSASVVSFINETPEEIAKMAELKPLEPIPILTSSNTNVEEEDNFSPDDEDEYMDTLVTENGRLIIKVNPTYIDCIVEGDQKISKNIPIKFKIAENIKVKEKLIPANTFIYAMPEIKEEDVNLKVNSFHTSKGFVILFMKALKQDLEDEMITDLDGEMALQHGDTVLFEY